MHRLGDGTILIFLLLRMTRTVIEQLNLFIDENKSFNKNAIYKQYFLFYSFLSLKHIKKSGELIFELFFNDSSIFQNIKLGKSISPNEFKKIIIKFIPDIPPHELYTDFFCYVEFNWLLFLNDIEKLEVEKIESNVLHLYYIGLTEELSNYK